MEPCRKRPRGGGSSSTEDRLSAPPDVLLQAILSSLKARQLVQTSVLSRRWRSLWLSVPCLHIDQGEFKSNTGCMSQRELQKFEDFGDFLLLRHDGSVLDSFGLRMTEFSLRCMVITGRWIRHALSCSLRALNIQSDSRWYVQVQVPPDLGSSSHCLTTLHLRRISLHGDFAELINSVCVVLEELELKECPIYFDKITCTSLRNLVMDVGYGRNRHSPSFCKHEDHLIISTPHLASLHLILWATCFRVSVNKMLSLVNASIRFEFRHPKTTNQNDQLRLLSNLFNVTSLELSGSFELVVSDVEPVEFPTFKNLRTLLLDKCDLSDNFQLVHHFLQNSPNLEKLTVQCSKLPKSSAGGKGRDRSKKAASCEFENQVDFQCQNLKSTEIMYRDGDNMRELVSVLLDISDRVPENIITLNKV